MRFSCALLLALLGTTFVAFTHAAQETEQLHTHSSSAEIHGGPGKQLGARLLRESDVVSTDDEERIGAKEWFTKSVKMQSKLKFWMYRGTTPEKVAEKLKVTSRNDGNYKDYSRYFFDFYTKYPDRQPSNLRAKTADEIMKNRMSKWLEKDLTPPQVANELKRMPSGGRSKSAYYYEYRAMWGERQARLSEAAVRRAHD